MQMALAESLSNDHLRIERFPETPNRDLPPISDFARWLVPTPVNDDRARQDTKTAQPNRTRATEGDLNQLDNGVLAMAASTSVKIEYGLVEKAFFGVLAVLLAVIAYFAIAALGDIGELKKGVAALDKGLAVTNTKLDTTNKSLDELSKKADKTNDQLNILIGRMPPTLRP